MIEGSEIVPISLQAASRRMPAHPGCPALAAVVVAVIFLVSAPMPLRAVSAELIGGTVSPGQGTTATSFVFVVDYASSPARDALSVRAEIVDADMTLDLALVGGNAAAGTWRASSHLPVGTWTITFKADAATGLDPTLTVSDAVVVTQATSPPTSPPSPPPTQAPTARPSPRTSPRPQPTDPPTPHPPAPAPQPTAPPGATASSPGWVAPIASSTAGTPRAGATPASSVAASPSATADASLTASPLVAARRDAATPGATPRAEPDDAATPTPEASDATSAGASIGRNAWLLLGGSLAVLGSAVLARQWLRRRPARGPDR